MTLIDLAHDRISVGLAQVDTATYIALTRMKDRSAGRIETGQSTSQVLPLAGPLKP